MTAKLSISVSDKDLEVIDAVARDHGGNRSAVIHDMVRIFRELQAEDDYIKAFGEWEGSEDQALWQSASGDGLE
ncbi:MAG: ribbon-helix-helix protein, CopG family [Leifsonia sp.]